MIVSSSLLCAGASPACGEDQVLASASESERGQLEGPGGAGVLWPSLRASGAGQGPGPRDGVLASPGPECEHQLQAVTLEGRFLQDVGQGGLPDHGRGGSFQAAHTRRRGAFPLQREAGPVRVVQGWPPGAPGGRCCSEYPSQSSSSAVTPILWAGEPEPLLSLARQSQPGRRWGWPLVCGAGRALCPAARGAVREGTLGTSGGPQGRRGTCHGPASVIPGEGALGTPRPPSCRLGPGAFWPFSGERAEPRPGRGGSGRVGVPRALRPCPDPHDVPRKELG